MVTVRIANSIEHKYYHIALVDQRYSTLLVSGRRNISRNSCLDVGSICIAERASATCISGFSAVDFEVPRW